ncbi:CBL-interacting protein kinase 26 [Diplonema papillatum]|nr:CBL-interacting protein kinase 26 [Diplonema papillatum]
MAESGSSENSSDPDRRIIAGRWEVLKQKLGEGNYGKVYLGRDLKNGVSIAIKVTNMQNLSKDLQERLKGETDILTQINHPNIVTLYDQLQNGRYQLLMLEYMQGRDMHRILVKGKPLSTDLVLKLFGDLTSGLSELHHRNIMHRDLKPQNLLLSSPEPENAVLKIADFGSFMKRYKERLW